MKKQLLAFASFGILLVSCADKAEEKSTAKSEEKKETLPPPPPMDSVAQMKAWQEYSMPSEVHKMMASWDGDWIAENTQWMDEKAPPIKGIADVTNKMIFDGRFQETTYKGTFMGMPFNGKGTLGYDNARKIFSNTWIDNMGTGIMTMEGTWDEATKTINFKGKTTDPMTKAAADIRETFTIVDANTQKMTMYMNGLDGKEFKSMEIIFKRKK
jgi:hypothetical protein